MRAELRAYETFHDHPAAEEAGSGGRAETEDTGKQFRRAFRVHIAGHHRALVQNSNFWSHPVVAEALTAEQRQIAEEAISDQPTVDAQKLEEADATIRYLRASILAADTELPHWAGFGIFWFFVLFAALLDFGCVLLLGEGLFLRLVGIATVNRKREKASRLRLLGTILAWSPCAVGVPLSMAFWATWLPGAESIAMPMLWALGIFTSLVMAAMAWAVWKPARSLQDIAVGTWLVPR